MRNVSDKICRENQNRFKAFSENRTVYEIGRFHPSQATKALRESRGIALLYF